MVCRRWGGDGLAVPSRKLDKAGAQKCRKRQFETVPGIQSSHLPQGVLVGMAGTITPEESHTTSRARLHPRLWKCA